MPTLHAVLEEYFGPKKCKLAGVFKPKFIPAKGTIRDDGTCSCPCHLIFQPTDEPYVVHAVDLNRRALLSSWLVCAVNRLPAFTKSFSLQVPASLGARKKISLSNPYNYETTFHLFTDRPNLLTFSNGSLLIPSLESRYVGLHFSPLPTGRPSAGETRLLVFVNNEEDQNEECMEISLRYSVA